MTRQILTGQIGPMTFFMPDDGAPALTSVVPIPTNSIMSEEIVIGDGGKEIKIAPRMEGEVEPDLDALFGTTEDGEPVIKPPETGKVTEEAGKPATEAPAKKEEASGAEPGKTLTEAKAPEIKEEAKKTEEAPKEGEKPPAAAIPKDDTDLDAIQPKPGSSPKIKTDFDRLKEQTKIARSEVRRINEEKAAIEAAKTALETKLSEVKPVSPEIETELTDLRAFRQRTLLGNDPELTKEFNAKLSTVENRLITLMKSEGLSDDLEKVMREKGMDSFSEEWWEKNVLTPIEDAPLLKAKVVGLLTARDQIKDERAAKVEEVTKNAGEYTKAQEEKTKKHWEDFSHKVIAKGNALAKDHPWARPIEIKDGMSPEEKAKAETHNIEFKARNDKFVQTIQKAVNLEPEFTTELVFSHFQKEILQKENETMKAEMKAEIGKKDTRIEELEKELGAMSRTGRSADKGAAPLKTPQQREKESKMSDLGKTAEQAMEEAGI